MSAQTPRLRGRPSKTKPQVPARTPEPKLKCVWCEEIMPDGGPKYVLQVENVKKTFCEQSCILQYRKVYAHGACRNCDNPIQNPANHKPFCSTGCSNDYEKKKPSEDGKKKGSDKVNNRISNNDHPPSPTFYKTNAQFIDWDSYLKETNSEAASARFFKQRAEPPENKFEIGMKLEAMDDRSLTSTCLATVVEKLGPRLRLRFDGCDNSNDFWRLVDSKEISVYGTAKKKGVMLQPPLGFRPNASSFNSFLRKMENRGTFAPAHLFIDEPPKPSKNRFKPGQKLEAVDPHCENYISVATVDKVENDDIYIIFDGCNKSYGFKCPYYSRDIFPVGWCEKCDHPLQHGRQIIVPSKSKIRTQTMSPVTLSNEDVVQQSSTASQEISVSSAPSPVTLIEADTSTVTPKTESQSCTSTSSECSSAPSQTEDSVKKTSYNQKRVTARPVKKSDGKVLITEQEAATSTTPAEISPKLILPPDPASWSIENVISYISDCDPLLSVHADLFRGHEIDGKALILLNSDTMMKYMGLKLGPALKICSLVSKIRNRRHLF